MAFFFIFVVCVFDGNWERKRKVWGREAEMKLQRLIDYVFVLFFGVNLFFITYIVDFEQIAIRDPSNFEYPRWPPKRLVDLVHWYGKNFDPLLIARPPFWMTTIWVDALFFGPFYVFAIYAFVRKRAWIRDVSIVWSSALIINVLCILSEEVYGVHRPENLRLVILLNMPWLVMPALNLARMLPRKDPWKGRSRKAKNASSVQPQAEPKAKAQTGKKGKSKAKKQN